MGDFLVDRAQIDYCTLPLVCAIGFGFALPNLQITIAILDRRVWYQTWCVAAGA